MNGNLSNLQNTISNKKQEKVFKKGINIDEAIAEKQKNIEELNAKIEGLKIQMQELLRTFII